MRIVFLTGQSGCGKNTQASKFIKFLESLGKKVLYIDNGDKLRGWDSGSWLSEHIKENNKTGGLAPQVVIAYHAIKTIEEYGQKPDFIIWNGSPRTSSELRNLKGFIKSLQVGFKDFSFKGEVVLIDVPDPICIRRIEERNKKENRPETNTPQSLNRKISFYNQFTVGALALIRSEREDYNKYFNLFTISGDNPEDVVFQGILNRLNL